MLIFIGVKINVYASTYADQFYISEVIDGIYYAKEKDGNIEYRRAKFKRRRDDNQIVYCIEPFVNMPEDANYKGYDYNYEKLLKLPKESWEELRLLSYYGYGYPGHTDEKWYPITQLLIWEIIDPEAKFYYTETFKGQKINRFMNEIQEIKTLIENHYKLPSFSNSFIKTSINSTLILEDTNKVLNNYVVSNNYNLDITIKDNELLVTTTDEEKEFEIILTKKDKIYQSLPIIYVSNTYQNILLVGSYEPLNTNFKLKVGSGNLKITKKDADNKTTIPQGEAQLAGTTYELYDSANNLTNKIVIDHNGEAYISKLKYGDYKLIETISGKGYLLDNKEYYFNINQENDSIELELLNEVIKSKIIITKYLKNDKKVELEQNVKFQVINVNNEIYKEIETNENGIAEFELPYGTYTIKQINTTEGYYKIDDFIITIDESSNKEIAFYLHDLKIPDTNEKNITLIVWISLIITSTVLLFIKINEKKSN